MTWINTISVNEPLASILAVLVALLLERFIPISSGVNPLSMYRFICQRMANKVLKTNYSKQQALISGSLGLIVLVTPTVLISFLIYEFASYQWLLDVFVLWILLQFTTQTKIFSATIKAAASNKTLLAKSLLQSVMLRDTQLLSEIGIFKACIEGLFLRYAYQYVTVIFCYFLGGPILALSYRLCYEANHAWSPKLKGFSNFGKLASYVCSLFQFIPSALLSISFMLTTSPFLALKALVSAQYWILYLRSVQLLLLFSVAQVMQVKTAGPVMYSQQKVRRQRLEGTKAKHGNFEAKEPSAKTHSTLMNLIFRHIIISASVMLVLVSLSFSVLANTPELGPSKSGTAHEQRIITLSPHLTELVYSLNKGQAIVGVSDYSDYPKAALSLPRVASYQGANLAQIARLKPSHVLVWRGGNKDADIQKLIAMGFNVYQSSIKHPSDLVSEISNIGKFLDATERANQLANQLSVKITQIEQAYSQRSLATLYYLNRYPLMGLGNDPWLNSLLQLCGLHNIYEDSLSAYPQLQVSDIFRKQPDLLIAADGSNQAQINTFWGKHASVFKGKYISANPDALHRFTIRALNEMERVCEEAYK